MEAHLEGAADDAHGSGLEPFVDPGCNARPEAGAPGAVSAPRQTYERKTGSARHGTGEPIMLGRDIVAAHALRRLARCYEGSEANAKAWLEVASMDYLLGRI
jgi:hypothetical protein